jgi:putative transcriptional regulator
VYYIGKNTICKTNIEVLGGVLMRKRRKWLYEARKNKSLTMAEVAARSKISESYYSMIESGNRNVPVHTAKKIAKALDFNWTKFYEDDPKA